MPVVVWDLLTPSLQGVGFVGYTCSSVSGSSSISTEDSEDEAVNPLTPGLLGRGRGKAPKWPAIFSTRTQRPDQDHQLAEQTPHCLLVSELTACEKSDFVSTPTKAAERIIKEFTQGQGQGQGQSDMKDPTKRFVCEDIQAFCSPAELEDLLGDGDVDQEQELVAMVDERPAVDGEGEGTKFVNRRELLEALLQQVSLFPYPPTLSNVYSGRDVWAMLTETGLSGPNKDRGSQLPGATSRKTPTRVSAFCFL